jgi:hypothetical protein
VGSHIEHIDSEIGVSTRGAAAMFARYGLVDPVPLLAPPLPADQLAPGG